jgi:lysophospholipase L1-like esterase
MRRVLALSALAAASLVFTLLAVEIFLRLFHPVTFMAPPAQIADDAWRGLLHQRSSIPGLAYELAPNRRAFGQGAMVETNSLGMRDDEPLPADTPGLFRIAVLGDSMTFGFGVAGEQTYPQVLERLLVAENSRRRQAVDGEDHRFEVLNMGVGGYSTPDEAIVLRHKALALEPRLIIIGYYLNDPDIEPRQPLRAYFQMPKWWQHFHLLRLLAEARASRAVERFGHGDYFMALHAPDQPMWKAVEAAFRQMHDDAAQRGIPVLLVILPRVPPREWSTYPYADLHLQVSAAARAAGLDVIDLLPAFEKEEPLRLRVIPQDEHLSPFGHEVTARAILEKLRADYRSLIGP